MTQLLENIFAVEVPEDAYSFCLVPVLKERMVVQYTLPIPAGILIQFPNTRTIQIQPGPYEILFTTKDCTEEQAEAILPDTIFSNPIDGLKFHLRTHNLDPSKNYLLLKKIS